MSSSYERRTKETEIRGVLSLYGTGKRIGGSGIGLFDHLLSALLLYGQMDLEIAVTGDLEVCQHHTIEDMGIVMGELLKAEIIKVEKIARYGSCYMPMDESLTRVVLDFSGRSYLRVSLPPLKERIGNYETETWTEFIRSMVRHSGMTLHIDCLQGENSHHILESIFKGLGMAIREAKIPMESLLSTKGAIDGVVNVDQTAVL